jgi:glycosyltransferase involved in cell wall biosynthesis
VVPTYNSSQTIRTVCKQILCAERSAEVVIVDDNSPDGTGVIADEIAASCSKVRVVHRPSKLGVGSAVYEGVLHAASDMVVVMDSDLHQPASVLPKMRELLNSGYDLVIVSRYASGSRFACSSALRLVVNKLGNRLACALLRLPVQDCTHGFRGYRKRAFLQSFDKSSEWKFQPVADGSFNLIVLANAQRQGFRIVEIPSSSTHPGKSNAGFAFRYMKTVLLIAFGRYRNNAENDSPSIGLICPQQRRSQVQIERAASQIRRGSRGDEPART